MNRILTTDFQTYISDLISKEFASVYKEEAASSESRKLTCPDHPEHQKRAAVFASDTRDRTE